MTFALGGQALPSIEKKLLLHTSVENFRCTLLTCRKEGNSSQVANLHAYARKGGLVSHTSLGNDLVPLLVEVGSLGKAHEAFETLVHKNAWCWNSLITGYINHGDPRQAFRLYQEMQESSSTKPIGHTFVALVKACTKLKDLKRGLQIHGEAAKTGLLARDAFVSSALLDMYLKCGSLSAARELFDSIPVRDVISWTALIAAYDRHGKSKEALYCFEEMQQQGVSPDAITFICSLKACGSLGDLEKGSEIHAEIDKKGLVEKDLVVATALVDMYAKCGSLARSLEVFDKIPQKNVVSWNALISGYTRHGPAAEALSCFDQMQSTGVPPDAVTFICSLNACGALGDIEKGQGIHLEVERQELLRSDVVVGTAVLDMYAKCGQLAKAAEVFQCLPVRSVVSWNALISGYAEYGFGDEALVCFGKMQQEGLSPDAITFAASLKACGSVGDSSKGQQIHCEISRAGLVDKDPVVGNALVDMYAKGGSFLKAQDVFDKLVARNVVSWNALISGYVDHGCGQKALQCYQRMQGEGAIPDGVTLVCTLRACSGPGDVDKGCEIHDKILRKGILEEESNEVGNTLVDMYAKCGWLSEARQVFDSLPLRDLVSWNAILAGYTAHGCEFEAFTCFEQMQVEGVHPDAVTRVIILKACGSVQACRKGQQVHCKLGSQERDVVIGTALVDLYVKCSSLDMAQQVFDNLPARDAVSWNALLSGYAEEEDGENAMKCFDEMQLEGLVPTTVTFVCSLKACGILKAAHEGMELHTEICRRNLFGGDLVGNTLVDMYAKCGMIGKAQEVFDNLYVRDVVSWTALVAGLTEHGHAEEALECLEKMQENGIIPNNVTYVFTLKACANMGASEKGREIHEEIERLGVLEKDLVISNALVDMYAKSGALFTAEQVFDNLPARGVACFNSLISGYAQLGASDSVFQMLERMVGEGLNPDSITYVVILSACCQSSLFDKGHTHFEAMSKSHGILPSLKHHTCMVDLLGRAGELEKALAVIKKLPSLPDLVLWHSMLGACQKWGNAELGRRAFEQAVRIDKKNAAAYVLLSSTCACADAQGGSKMAAAI